MKPAILSLALIAMAISPARAVEFRAELYGELGGQGINTVSFSNPANMYALDPWQFSSRADLIVKNSFGGHLRGVGKFEFRGVPLAYSSQTDLTEFVIKELYADLLTDVVSVRGGKQYIKWGSGSFFNPIDVVNLRRDPLRPINEAEGNTFVQATVPLCASATFDLVCPTRSGDNNNGAATVSVIPRISAGTGPLSGFVFAAVEKDKKPLVGVNVDYAFSLRQSLSGNLYNETLYKLESERLYIVETHGLYRPAPQGPGHYWSALFGVKFQYSAFSSTWFDGAGATIEYSHDTENWRGSDYENYLDYLQTLQSNPPAHATALPLAEAFHNSRDYLYASFSLQSFVVTDLQPSFGIICNLSDGSLILNPEISYSLWNSNLLLGVRAFIYTGPDRSEFTNNVSRSQAMLFSQISF